MLDFVSIRTQTKVTGRKGAEEVTTTVYPEFLVMRSEDLMIRGGDFYAVWDEDNGAWSKDKGVVARIVDAAILDKQSKYPPEMRVEARTMRNFSSNCWSEFVKYCKSLPDSYHDLDAKLVFQDSPVRKDDYSSRRLGYSIKHGKCDSYEEMVSTLYDPEERSKIEWSIGAVLSGDSKKLQKFLVFYGQAGSGKSTMLNIIEMLFQGYCSTFEAKALTGTSNAFALEAFKDNPLVAIQHDGDLSRIEDNTKLNSIVSHEKLIVNEKRKTQYEASFNAFLFMGTNRPVKITDAKSGITRRLIDVRPSNRRLDIQRYTILMSQIPFELGAIASKCLSVYKDMGAEAYDAYRPLDMLGATNDFYNYMSENYDVFAGQDATTLKQAYALYREYCEDSDVKYPLSKTYFKEELKSYFKEFHTRFQLQDGTRPYNVYRGFIESKFGYFHNGVSKVSEQPALKLGCTVSKLDDILAECKAQYAKQDGTPERRWSEVATVLKDLDTTKLHYIQVPSNHIVVDFDIQDEYGSKSLERNLKAAARWPSTYAELSRSGNGVHLHYIYDGDPNELAPVYSDHVEVKVYTGNAALRRKFTECNDIEVATISSGLPKKKGAKMVDFEGLKNEKALRTLIKNNLKKKYHPGTKPSVAFIKSSLDEFHASGKHYDVTDMRPAILSFAAQSTHWSLECLEMVKDMKFHSEDVSEGVPWKKDIIVFYDVEVFPNLFVVVYKQDGEEACNTMINPTPTEIEELCGFKLVGFNNRRYDNHILYARMMGYTNGQLYNLSQKIINGSKNAMFREAYNLSYADVYDFSSKKQSLKKWEIELGIHHKELGLPWDEPVDESLWLEVAAYCVNDVVATEAVFDARQADFRARELLADLSGLTINDTTRMHATRIMFGRERKPQEKFVYTDLSEMFPGYKFEYGKSSYRGEDPSEGGYVYSEPGMYKDVALLDVESMHPTSIEELNLFGPYTERFSDIKNARLAIKHGDYEKAKTMLDGKLAAYLGNEDDASDLSYALKIIINSVYGYTSAKFDCEFKDPRNVDNIVAKRGALFMIDLKNAVQEKGYSVAHIKTDSIKIPNADEEIIRFVTEFGAKYGYRFEHEATYDRFCLVNDAVYICHDESGWHATGAQFAVPYVFKTLFSGAEIEFDDLCETRTVSGTSSLYLDMNEELPEGEHHYVFVGRAGRFTPVKKGSGGGLLLREKDGKYYAVTGTKGFRWMESEMVKSLKRESDIDDSYYKDLASRAVETISQYGDFDIFVKE